MTQFRVAVVQAGAVPFDSVRSIEKACSLAADAAKQGAKLVLFPEALIAGYPKGLDFGARVGMRTPEGRNDFRRYWESAIDVPSPATDILATSARENKSIWLSVSLNGRTVLFIARHCSSALMVNLMGKHRKLMPTAMERLIWGFGDGSTLPVFQTPIGRIGSVICWENYMPMLRMAMYSKGIQIYCAPTADDRDTCIPSMQHIAMEGRCFVLSCCQYITRGAYPKDYSAIQGDDPETLLLRGGSCIVGPFGEILAGPHYDKECILTADIDLGEIAKGKYDFDVVGHYARPDVFRLYVNERATPSVVWNDSPAW